MANARPRDDEGKERAAEDPARQSRADEKRAEDLARGSQSSFKQDLDGFRYQPLPDAPKIPGYHTIWLSETNRTQTVQNYLRMGYELVEAEEINAQQFEVPTTGGYKGKVKVNEMILAKVPLERYYQIMRHFHHDEPLSDETSIREQVEGQAEQARSAGTNIALDSGMQTLGKAPGSAPTTWQD